MTLAETQEDLDRWPTAPPDNRLDVSVLDRLRRALRGLARDDDSTGPGDIAGLVGHALRRAEAKGAVSPRLLLPAQPPFPTEAEWIAFGCTAVRNAGRLEIRAAPWLPAWLGNEAVSPIAAALREDERRSTEKFPTDPRVRKLTGHASYSCRGQRDAVRSAFLLPQGEVLLALLPTGAGKTLVFEAPALDAARRGGLSVLVVPTTALALDLERRWSESLRSVLPEFPRHCPIAYHSGRSDEERDSMRRRIRDGDQRLLLTSPESLEGGLKFALFAAAREGRLAWLGIDEAHVVAKWGADFRPEYQSMAALRRALLAECPTHARFRTLLMTATLSEDAMLTLKTLYGGKDLQVVSSLHLRPEIDYYRPPAFAANAEARRDFVLEAARHLPRPFLLYTSKRDDAEHWTRRLRELGMRRVLRVIGGDLAGPSGVRDLEAWQQGEIDVVVATAAFGLGMDQSDVRAVLHACLPESLDRFYQEAGRAGRDGRAAVSLLVPTVHDEQTARHLNRRQLIGEELGRARFDSMWARREPVPDRPGLLSLPLDAARPGLMGGNDKNEAWNLRTILLLVRSGVLELEALPPPRPGDFAGGDAEREQAWSAALALHEQTVIVGVSATAQTGPADPETWNKLVGAERNRSADADQSDLDRMLAVARGDRMVAEALLETYSLPEHEVLPSTSPWVSCPMTRAEGLVRFECTEPEPHVTRRVQSVPSEELFRALQGALADQQAFVAYERPIDERAIRRLQEQFRRLVRRMAGCGVREFATSADEMLTGIAEELAVRASSDFLVRAVINDASEPESSPLARVSLLGPRDQAGDLTSELSRLTRRLHVAVVPSQLMTQTGYPRRFLENRASIPLALFLERLDQ